MDREIIGNLGHSEDIIQIGTIILGHNAILKDVKHASQRRTLARARREGLLEDVVGLDRQCRVDIAFRQVFLDVERGRKRLKTASVNTGVVACEEVFIGVVPDKGPDATLAIAMLNPTPYYLLLVGLLGEDISLVLILDEKVRVGLRQVDVRSVVEDVIGGISTHNSMDHRIRGGHVVVDGNIAVESILLDGGGKHREVPGSRPVVIALMTVR